MQLQDKLAVITGSGRGIGRAMALAFAAKKCNLMLLDLNTQDLERTRSECEELGVRVLTAHCNVAEEHSIAAAIDTAIEEFERLDVMINNAGITRDALLVKAKDSTVLDRMSVDQWRSVIDVNLTGVFLGGREAATRMIQAGNGGVIINVSSISRAGNAGQTNYSAAKAGVDAMTVVWAKELARYGIRTGAIAPGFTRTEILDAMKPEMIGRALAAAPLKRMAEPAEIAQAAIFIAENDYFSGRIIEVDGAQRL
ncbi:MAG TPA: SDR family NAD(P)-dependent oxidoreductase [Steroidobacteraceae bacterium]|nr:SDR family NAD(P)-dependent oxidoreductase [Steroidobacteraceae bacterium]